MPSWILALDFGGTKHTLGVIDSASCLAPSLAAGRAPYGSSVSEPNPSTRAAPAQPGAIQRDLHSRGSFSRSLFSAYHSQVVPAGRDGRQDFELMLAAAHQALDGRTPAAIGVSFGGPVDAARGVVPLSHHIPGWENFPLRDALEQAFSAPASVDNDANVAALGEHCYGGGQDVSSMMYITVSTGVGGGWILNGRVWHGAGSMAGEIGHTVVDPAGPACLCGKRGCVERLASGPFLAQDARSQIRAELDAGLLSSGQLMYDLVAGRLDELRGETISQAASQGDALALELVRRAGWAVGVGIGNAANLINPQRFLLAGGVTKMGAAFWDELQQTARRTALPQVALDIRPAALGDDAPLWGAAALGQVLLHEPPIVWGNTP